MPQSTLPQSVGPDTRLLIISHDCDIVNPSYDAEPFIEVLVARPREEGAFDGCLSKGKNPRKIQFRMEEPESSKLYEINVHEKYSLDRQILEKGSPDSTIKIAPDDVRVIARWAARRYHRPALPSTFIERVSPARKKILKKLEKDGGDISDVLLGFETLQELPSNQPYRVLLRLVLDPEACNEDSREQRALGVVGELRKLIAQCAGIEVYDADIVSSAEITVHEYTHLKRWDVEYLSPAEDE